MTNNLNGSFMIYKTKNILLLLCLTLIVALYGMPALADAGSRIEIPAKVISPRSMMVVYINRDDFTASNIKDGLHAFTDAIPKSNKKLKNNLNKSINQLIKSKENKLAAA